MRGPWRQLNGPWQVHRSRGCPFARRLAAPTTASLACLASPTCERYREIQGVNCGRTALSTYCDRWLVLLVFAALIDWRIVRRLARVSQNVNACRRLASLLVIHRSRKRVAASCLPSYRHPCLGSLRRCSAIHGYTSASFTTPGLRSVTPVRTSFVAKPPHFAFPTLGRSDLAGPASASLRWPSLTDPPRGILPPGFVMRRHPCRRRSAIYPRLAASRRNSPDALRVRRFAPVRFMLDPVRAASCHRVWRTSCPPIRKATLRWPVETLLHSGAVNGLSPNRYRTPYSYSERSHFCCAVSFLLRTSH